MTEKRFEYEKNTDSIWFWKNGMKYQLDARNLEDCVEALNTLSDENEQLKKREEQLLFEIEDFQQLLTKNDNIYYKQVINIIDNKISFYSDTKKEFLSKNDDDYIVEKMSFGILILEELKIVLQQFAKNEKEMIK